MKHKDIENLLAQEYGTLRINEMFKLVRWQLIPEKDMLGRSGEYLRLEMTNHNSGITSASRKIKSREINALKGEVEIAMAEMMEEFTQRLLSGWRGGRWL